MNKLFILSLLASILNLSLLQSQAVETIVQAGHYAPILSVDYSSDGRLIATAGKDNTVKLWEVATGRELRSFSGHRRAVRSVRFSPEGDRLISVGYDQQAIVWEVATGKLLNSITHEDDEIRSAIFSPKGTYILTGGHKTNAVLWDATGEKKLKTFRTKPGVCYQCASSLKFSPDEKYIYTSAENRTALVWQVSKADTVRSIRHTPGSCSSCNSHLDLSSPGTFMAKADYSGALYTVDPESGKMLKQLAEKESFKGVSVHPDARHIMGVIDYNGKVRIWEIRSGKVLRDIEAHGGINEACFSPDGKYIVTAGEDGKATLWDFATGRHVRDFKGIVTRIEEKGLSQDEMYYINLLKDTELSPDGKLVGRCQIGHATVLWDFESGRIVKKFIGHESVVTCLVFSPDGKFLATGSADRTIKIWNIDSASLVRTIPAHGALILSLQFGKDGRQLISGSWDGLFKVWDVGNGELMSSGRVHEGSPYSSSLTANGLYAVSGGLDRTLKLTELDSRTEVRSFVGHTDVVHSIGFNEPGDVMLTAGWDGTAKLWEVRTGWQIRKLTGHEHRVYDANFGPHGKLIITGSEDKTAKLWNAETGRLLRTFSGHQGGVNYACITPDGRKVLTAGRDRTVKIWDLESGKELVTHVTLNENEWMAKTNEGYFEGTPNATKTLFFVKGTKSYALDQFFQQFYKPGVFHESLTASVRSAGENKSIFGLLEASPPPVVEILAPEDGWTAKNNHQEIILKVTNAGGGIREILLHHNGKRLDLPDQLGRTPRAGQDMVLTYSVALVPGENEITIAGTSDQQVESKAVGVTVNYEGTQKQANLYLLAIGINDYDNPALSLNYARSDAESFADLVEKRSKKLFKKVETTLLLDKEATKEKILATLRSISTVATKEDVFYLYYAGHGGTYEQEFYFIPVESVSLYQGDKLNDQAISATTINEILKTIPALKQVVVLDACHSGASTQVLAARGLSQEKALAQLARSTGIHIMAAAGSDQQAIEFGQLGHGVFTFALIEALEGKADGAPVDSKVTIYELKSYLDDQVPELSKKYQGKTQYPSTFSLGQDFPMVLNEN